MPEEILVATGEFPEPCQDCRGRGVLGTMGMYAIICEGCSGHGIVLRDRAVILPREVMS